MSLSLLCLALNPFQLPLPGNKFLRDPPPSRSSSDRLSGRGPAQRSPCSASACAPHCLGCPALPCPPSDVPLILQVQLMWEKPFLAPPGRSGSFHSSVLLRPSPRAGLLPLQRTPYKIAAIVSKARLVPFDSDVRLTLVCNPGL